MSKLLIDEINVKGNAILPGGIKNPVICKERFDREFDADLFNCIVFEAVIIISKLLNKNIDMKCFDQHYLSIKGDIVKDSDPQLFKNNVYKYLSIKKLEAVNWVRANYASELDQIRKTLISNPEKIKDEFGRAILKAQSIISDYELSDLYNCGISVVNIPVDCQEDCIACAQIALSIRTEELANELTDLILNPIPNAVNIPNSGMIPVYTAPAPNQFIQQPIALGIPTFTDPMVLKHFMPTNVVQIPITEDPRYLEGILKNVSAHIECADAAEGKFIPTRYCIIEFTDSNNWMAVTMNEYFNMPMSPNDPNYHCIVSVNSVISYDPQITMQQQVPSAATMQ